MVVILGVVMMVLVLVLVVARVMVVVVVVMVVIVVVAKGFVNRNSICHHRKQMPSIMTR